MKEKKRKAKLNLPHVCLLLGCLLLITGQTKMLCGCVWLGSKNKNKQINR